jgi:DMSO/TMAO reductase YedYZ molybdopterin-dependent catalytic subunit
VLHAGKVPEVDTESWRFRVFRLVEEEELTYEEFMALPMVRVYSDIHCLTGWSMLEARNSSRGLLIHAFEHRASTDELR